MVLRPHLRPFLDLSSEARIANVLLGDGLKGRDDRINEDIGIGEGETLEAIPACEAFENVYVKHGIRCGGWCGGYARKISEASMIRPMMAAARSLDIWPPRMMSSGCVFALQRTGRSWVLR